MLSSFFYLKSLLPNQTENGNFMSIITLRSKLLSAIVVIASIVQPWLVGSAGAAVVEFNSTGGTSGTNGLHFYIEDTTHLQVRRLDNTGQVYSPTALPPSTSLDNGVFLLANKKVYGPSHSVGGNFNPSGGMYNTFSITATSPANPSSVGVQQIATNNFGINSGPQVSLVWKYTTPLDFITAEVTLTIPAGYAVSAANPVRYYHVIDTYLGGSDSGCGLLYTDSNSNLVVGTYAKATSGTACPSTSVPSGNVESFRERSGQPFSSYCAAGWSTFFNSGSPNCSVTQTAPLSNTIVTSYQDTGMAIEIDFSAPGTYTFSYDFVIGSTVVPAYDHVEIVHDGSATLCPEKVTVLACTSSTIPCPVGSIVNSGTLTGNLTVSPSSPAVTVTPSSFSIGPTNFSPTMVLQGSGAGSYTLGVSNISGTAPLNGIKCWNGTSASCTLTIANSPCVSNFECIESSQTYNNLVSTPAARNPLYTKLAGTPFKFDIVALQSTGAVASSYTGSVSVELFDDTVPQAVCSAYSSPVTAAQTLTFASADNGRKTIASNVTLPNAYRKLRCRATQTVPTAVSGCSSDDFAVRPTAITSVTSAGATADAAGLSASNTPIIKTGATFSLTANTATAGYDDKPQVVAGKVEWLNAPVGGRVAPGTGTLAGLFTTSAAIANGNGASGNAFTYDEVGYFRFQALGVLDNTFTTYSNDLSNGDCTNDASNVLVGGKYGCNFGNTALTSYFGRFIPDHFTVGVPVLTNNCTTATPFSYFGQDGFSSTFTLTAQNSTNLTTQNYVASFARMNMNSYASYGFSAAPLSAGSLLTSSATAPSGIWLSGVANVTAKHQISRPTALAAQSAITISAAPTDGEVPAVAATAMVPAATMRYGRMRIQNAHGSELLDLPVSLITQYWNGSLWVQNIDDSCTPVIAPTAGAGLTFVAEVAANVRGNHLSASETTASVNLTGVLSGGNANLKFSKPGAGNSGYIDIAFPVSAWLKFPWMGGANVDPPGRATFGVYKNANEFIYLRELH